MIKQEGISKPRSLLFCLYKRDCKNILKSFQKPIDKGVCPWYNVGRYPKTAGSGKSTRFPAEEMN